VGKLTRDDGRIDWSRSAVELERRIRAYHPWPGTYTTLEQGGRVKIFPPTTVLDDIDMPAGEGTLHNQQIIIGCGQGAIALTDVQAEGGKRMSAVDFARGQRGGFRFAQS
jgi:methionyl-tRNA formyltransferase